ncbi:MAG: endonuclease/exonuclease/phosphatase family protein [Firmicutes bacterium]|uniref:Metal-dependent hydrolase, endonuclease/exonuclease/phosphatase family n=1 Tax=Melghirimyces thermohalophilus TaxID=1236220 RepID=A0A1G6P3U7_9BACL|nr:endonuclease/exonuclease/phosphatase family protein [Melghirimyces thermohalophilus]MDA8352608.1 endonuclease/exonuclease/phosphatase family protein [Bacillota bacterium]SDC74940.1 Metal-dependent hydrolase, endonuclease/exonuclease/phosphatase family [Melghirimyces thermohalophilus]
MKVMAYNIRHGWGCDGRVDLERIAQVIEQENPDLVGLNEVDVHFHRRSGFTDQLSHLATRLGMSAVFGPAITRGSEISNTGYGNGLLLKGNVLRSENILVTRMGEETRALLVVELQPEGVKHRVCTMVTHMGLTPWMRRKQTDVLIKQLQKVAMPIVVTGDWNVIPCRPVVRRLNPYLRDVLAEWGVKGATYPCSSPRKRIDYIFCSSHFQIMDAKVVDHAGCPSDHLPITCRLERIPT